MRQWCYFDVFSLNLCLLACLFSSRFFVSESCILENSFGIMAESGHNLEESGRLRQTGGGQKETGSRGVEVMVREKGEEKW